MHQFIHHHPLSITTRLTNSTQKVHPFPVSFGRKFFEVTNHYLDLAWKNTRLIPKTTSYDQLCRYHLGTIKIGWNQWQELSTASATDELDLALVEKYIDNFWDWDALSLHSHLTVEFVEKHWERPWNWGWDGLSARDDLFSPEYMAAHPEFPWEFDVAEPVKRWQFPIPRKLRHPPRPVGVWRLPYKVPWARACPTRIFPVPGLSC